MTTKGNYRKQATIHYFQSTAIRYKDNQRNQNLSWRYVQYINDALHLVATMTATEKPTDAEFKPYEAKTAGDKLAMANKQNPLVTVGIGLGVGVLGYMLYRLRTSTTKTSVHLIHTRMGVQGTVIGCLTIAAGYQTWL